MSEILPMKDPQDESSNDLSVQLNRGQSGSSEENQIYKKASFRISCISSFLIHTIIFLWVFIFSAETESRFYGSGTAVSLIGADEIPGGSAKGKSGDVIPRERKKVEIEKIVVKKKILKKKQKTLAKPILKKKEKVRIISPEKKKKVKKPKKKVKKAKIKVQKKTKKKIQNLSKKRKPKKRIRKKKKRRRRKKKKINAGQKRYQAYLKKFEKKTRNEKKNTKKPKQFKLAQKENRGKVQEGKSNKVKPKVGYRGDGGGDGQGGGSIQPSTGGIGNVDTALKKFYGTLIARISNFTEFPPIGGIDSLRVQFAVDIYRNGKFRNLRIEKYSGNKTYDLSAKNAILRAFDPLVPAFPEALKEKMLQIGFRFCGAGICR